MRERPCRRGEEVAAPLRATSPAARERKRGAKLRKERLNYYYIHQIILTKFLWVAVRQGDGTSTHSGHVFLPRQAQAAFAPYATQLFTSLLLTLAGEPESPSPHTQIQIASSQPQPPTPDVRILFNPTWEIRPKTRTA
eukprot:scaffold85314_cov30-Tisochrysis_lutea.AAC.1